MEELLSYPGLPMVSYSATIYDGSQQANKMHGDQKAINLVHRCYAFKQNYLELESTKKSLQSSRELCKSVPKWKREGKRFAWSISEADKYYLLKKNLAQNV